MTLIFILLLVALMNEFIRTARYLPFLLWVRVYLLDRLVQGGPRRKKIVLISRNGAEINIATNVVTVISKKPRCLQIAIELCGRRSGLMVSALVSGSSDPGSNPGRGHCVVFLGKTLYSHSAFLHPGV